MSSEEVFSRINTDIKYIRLLTAVFAVILVSAALYFGRIVLEPIAFMLFAMALLGPFQKAVELRIGKGAALILTLLLTFLCCPFLSGPLSGVSAILCIGDLRM